MRSRIAAPPRTSPSGASLSWISLALLAVVSAGLIALWSGHLDGASVDRDEAQTLQLALNLQRHGTMSNDRQEPYKPSMQREPLPILTTAGSIVLLDALMGRGDPSAYFDGRRAHWLRVQNTLWMAALFATSFWIIWSSTASFATALIGAGIIGVLPATPGVVMRVDQLDTEVFAALLLLWSCWLLMAGFTRGRVALLIASGACFGLLALAKAAVLYIFAGVIATLLVLRLLHPVRELIPNPARQLGILSLAFIVVIAPWMGRNYVQFGTLNISTRGGSVMMLRAIKNLMTPQEYVGAFYVWSPGPLRGVVGRILGFTRADLERGGRLQRLNRSPASNFAKDDLRAQLAGRPEDAISYYRKGQAEVVKVRDELTAAGNPDADEEADKIIQKRAERLILQHPFRHLALTIPFLWRGATFAFPLLLVAIAASARRGGYRLALFVWPALGLVMFYALLTHFIPRYGSPALPIAIVAACLAIHEWRRGAVPAAQFTRAADPHG